ncbi:MAG TPA: hypothetical protein VFH24_07105 [Gemmatimonadales bacterium]|nr:hypothetical protein [Gemmatimonadales bacterium]
MTVLLVAGCGGGSTAPVQPTTSAAAAVRGFMQAVADSNVDKMASLWGTANGPASQTRQPPDYERRVAIMQAYLRNDSYRVTSDVEETPTRRTLQVQLRRKTCTWSVPFVSLKTNSGSWLINQVDLTAAGNPARPCMESNGDTLSRP